MLLLPVPPLLTVPSLFWLVRWLSLLSLTADRLLVACRIKLGTLKPGTAVARDGAWNARPPALSCDSSNVDCRLSVRRSTTALRTGLSTTSSSESESDAYWLSGIMMRESSSSSETEFCTSASVIGRRARPLSVRRKFGGGRFSFWEVGGDLRFRGLDEGILSESVWESGMTISASAPNTSCGCCDCDWESSAYMLLGSGISRKS